MSPTERQKGNRTEQLQRKYRNGVRRVPDWAIHVAGLGVKPDRISRKRTSASISRPK